MGYVTFIGGAFLFYVVGRIKRLINDRGPRTKY
jgi:hypothetical protein